MKTTTLKTAALGLLLFAFAGWGQVRAQEATGMSNGLGFGFQLNQYGGDFGLGLNLTSPYLFNNSLAVRARANYAYFEHVVDLETVWTPYNSFTLGLVGQAGTIGNSIRLYGEGGVVLINPNDDFSSEDSELGGYGLFGFEFYFFKHGNYFIELGGMGSGATADQVLFEPIYSNGFMISTGLRFVL